MTNPMNAIRNFKANRNASTDNVAQFRREAPISTLHHARADEAEVEVTIEPVTCEDVTMSDNKDTAVLRASLNDLNETIETVLAEPELANTIEHTVNVADAKAKEAAMNNTTEQTSTISVTDFATRVKHLNRKRIATSVLLNTVAGVAIVAGAALNGRDVKRSAITAGIIGSASVAIDALSRGKRADVNNAAARCSEESYQDAVKVDKKELTSVSLWTAGVGLFIGAFMVKKAVDAIDAE